MKFNKTMKKCLSVVLSLAMILSSVTIYSNTAKAADEDVATMVASADFNLALSCKVTSNFTFGNEGNLTNLTSGKMNGPRVYPNPKDGGGYYQIDLGKYYTVDSIDQIVHVFNETNAETYPSKDGGYYIQYSLDGSNFTEARHVTGVTLPETAPYTVVEDLSDVTEIEGLAAVRYVRLFYPERYGYGIQVKQLAVLNVNGDAAEAEIEMCDNAAGVEVSSGDYNTITYKVIAGEGQEDYVYNVYLDDAEEIGINVAAGQEYTVSGIASGTHTVKVISSYDGKVSEGITSAEVTVEDVSVLVTGTRNIANVNNNAEAKISAVSAFYDDNFTLETAQVALDGKFPTGEGNSVALRTKGTPADVIIDLGAEYTPKQFEQVMLAYSNPRTYAATTSVSFSRDGETYTEVGNSTGYLCKVDGGGTADLNAVPLDAEKIAKEYDENAVRYIKITLSEGQSGWGYVVNEISVIIKGDVSDAEIYAGKEPVEAPEIAGKVYTGETLTADVEDTDFYTVTENAGGIDAGSYNVVLTLKDPDHYCWSDDPKERAVTKTVAFEIGQAANEWTSELAIESWKYGEEAKNPTITAKFGEAVYTYSATEDGEYTADVPENAGTYYVKAVVEKNANYAGLDAVTTSFEIAKADQDAPEEIGIVDSTLEENADGMIIGVTDAMEYRAADDTEYTAIEGTEIEDVLSGTYYVRYKETENYNASADTEVVVGTGRKLLVTLPEGEGYTITANVTDNEVEYGTEVTFKVDIATGYKKDTTFAVKVNGEAIEVAADGAYKVEVTEAVEVTVEGIVKDIPPVTTPSENGTTTKAPGTTEKPDTTKSGTAGKILAKTKITKAPSKKLSAKKVKITFKKVKGAKKYQVQIATDKKFKKIIIKKTVKKVKVTITNKKLAKKKKLFVRVRAVGAKKWSTVKKIKIKK